MGTEIVEITPHGESTLAGLREIWEARDLLAAFTKREIQLRYQQTTIGLAWVLLQPLSIMLVLTVFATLVGVRAKGVPYPLFTLSGLVPWSYFVHALTKITFSLLSQSGLLGRIYFPRLIIPLAAALAGAVDLLVAALLLPLFMIAYGLRPGWEILALPFFVVLALAAALGLGLWLAALNVRYRDVGNALPFVTQMMFFAAPIVYPSSLIPQPWRTLSGVNPMAGVIEGFRWSLFGARSDGIHAQVAVSVVAIGVLLGSGLWFFRWQETTMVDELG